MTDESTVHADCEDRLKKLRQTIAAFPDAHSAANLAHARAERDRLRREAAAIEARVRAEVAGQAVEAIERVRRRYATMPFGQFVDSSPADMVNDCIAAVAALAAGSSPDTTPEAKGDEQCQRCHGPNPPWSAPSPLWNAVMRGNDINGTDDFSGIVCATCFTILAEERIGAGLWRLSAQRVPVELETVTPSGRIWDDEAWLWREPAEPRATPREDS